VTRVVLGVAVVLYLCGTLAWIDRFPAVSQDEPWIASSGYKLATAGALGSDLFSGYHGMDQHHFVQMPVYPVLQAAVFRIFGLGVVQMRALSVVFGLALLLAIHGAGREIGGERLGVLAAALAVVQSLTASTAVRPIGILLLDSARMNRYDIAVPVFGLAALWVVLRETPGRRSLSYCLAGCLAGLSGLSHLYGAFWLPTLIVFLVLSGGPGRSTFRAAGLLIAGFALVWLPWAIWVGLHWSDYVAQMRTVGSRFDIFSPAFYRVNVISGDGPMSIGWAVQTLRGLPLRRVGAWTLAIAAPIATWLLIRRGQARTAGELALLTATAIQCLLFVALLEVKSINYMIALWPLGALMEAWLIISLWDRRRAALRGLIVAVCGAVAIEGGVRLFAAAGDARHTTSYDWFERQVAGCIPAGSLVLGFQHYWLGLHDFPYRTWLLPLNMANPAFETTPIPVDVALQRINPNVILMDRYARQLFQEAANPSHPYHYLAVGFDAYRQQRTLLPRCVVRDETYDTMEVYEVGSLAKRGEP
jgi:4-amino-4-deoxy-L-arabinose transferase-like glycosyltransferase